MSDHGYDKGYENGKWDTVQRFEEKEKQQQAEIATLQEQRLQLETDVVRLKKEYIDLENGFVGCNEARIRSFRERDRLQEALAAEKQIQEGLRAELSTLKAV